MVSCISQDVLTKFYSEESQDSSSEASQEIIEILQNKLQVEPGAVQPSQIEICNQTCLVLLENETLIKAIGWDLLHVLINFTTPDLSNHSMTVLRCNGSQPIASRPSRTQLHFIAQEISSCVQSKGNFLCCYGRIFILRGEAFGLCSLGQFPCRSCQRTDNDYCSPYAPVLESTGRPFGDACNCYATVID
jgi:hypothetical protein